MRQTGTTTQQILSAPKDSLFIWCTLTTTYATELCKHLGRTDLTVLDVSVLDYPDGLKDKKFTSVVVDHAVKATPERHAGLTRLMYFSGTDVVKNLADLKNRLNVEYPDGILP